MNTKTLLDATASNKAHRDLGEEVVALRERCEKLRQLVVLKDNGYRRCGGCGNTWHDGDKEVHDEGCIAAPVVPPRPRASSSAQKPRVAASKRRR